MTKELLQQALDALIESRDDVVTGLADRQRLAGIPRYDKQITFYEAQLVKHDAAIEGLKQALAQQEQPAAWTHHQNPVHHTGPFSEEHLRDVVERTKAMQVALDAWVAQAQSGQTEVPCPLAFVERLASVDAYVGAREDAAIWKKRALEAEELNRKFIAELNGPTYLGEPVKQEQPAERDGIPEWTPAIGIECAILNLNDNAMRLRHGSHAPLQIADDLDVIATSLAGCLPVAQQGAQS